MLQWFKNIVAEYHRERNQAQAAEQLLGLRSRCVWAGRLLTTDRHRFAQDIYPYLVTANRNKRHGDLQCANDIRFGARYYGRKEES